VTKKDYFSKIFLSKVYYLIFLGLDYLCRKRQSGEGLYGMFCVICMLRSEAGRWPASTRGLKSTPSFLLMNNLARQSELRNKEIGHVEVEAMIRKVHEMK
jgi:hypothetical protein